MVGKKGYHLTPNGWLYNSMRMVMRWLRMQRLMSPIGVKIMDTISLLQVLNTVLPGYTEGDITIHAMEPMVKEGEFVNDREFNSLPQLCRCVCR